MSKTVGADHGSGSFGVRGIKMGTKEAVHSPLAEDRDYRDHLADTEASTLNFGSNYNLGESER